MYNKGMKAMGQKKKTARMGRPPKPAADKCGIQICCKITRAELRFMQAEARRLGLSMSSTLMYLWRERMKKRT